MCKVVGVADKVSRIPAADLSHNLMLVTSRYLKRLQRKESLLQGACCTVLFETLTQAVH